jgi:hypothetical protein
VMEVVEAVTE